MDYSLPLLLYFHPFYTVYLIQVIANKIAVDRIRTVDLWRLSTAPNLCPLTKEENLSGIWNCFMHFVMLSTDAFYVTFIG